MVGTPILIYYLHTFEYLIYIHFNVLLTHISITTTTLSVEFFQPSQCTTYTHFNILLPPFRYTTYIHFNLLLTPISEEYLPPFPYTTYIHVLVCLTPVTDTVFTLLKPPFIILLCHLPCVPPAHGSPGIHNYRFFTIDQTGTYFNNPQCAKFIVFSI